MVYTVIEYTDTCAHPNKKAMPSRSDITQGCPVVGGGWLYCCSKMVGVVDLGGVG